MGAPGSPYTRKMLSLMRFREIPFRVHWTTGQVPKGFPKPKVALLPTYFLPGKGGEIVAVTDSTPLIRRFEKAYEGRSVIPADPIMAFFNDLIEDFADEWLTKVMFHYRWAHEADTKNAGPLLVFWGSSVIDDGTAKGLSDYFTKRQVDRLYVVGSNETTRPIIEAAYIRFVSILDRLIAQEGYVLGGRPSSADFAIFGQMTQIGIIEPTSAKITRDISARVRAWIDRMEDLSGLSPKADDWFDASTIKVALGSLLTEIGRTYAPVMLANAKAVMTGEKTFETRVDDAPWTQPSFRYQAKTLGWIRESYFDLKPKDQNQVDEILRGTGCEALFET